MENIKQLKCAFCLDTPSIPVIVIGKTYECKWCRPCLTCWRDATNANNVGNHQVRKCPTCQKDFTLNSVNVARISPNKSIIISDLSYQVDEITIEVLDNLYPNGTACPRECEWQGLRKDARAHLKMCPNSFRFQCKGCNKMFNRSGLLEHLDISTTFRRMVLTTNSPQNCRARYEKCQFCEIVFIENECLEDHLKLCNKVPRCVICSERVNNNIDQHQAKCAIKEVVALRNKLNKFKEQLLL